MRWKTIALLSALVLVAGCVSPRGRRCGCPRATGTPSAVKVALPEATAPDVWAFHATRYDADRDGKITPDEYTRGPGSFARLDRDKDGHLTKADFEAPMGMDQLIAVFTMRRVFQDDDDPALTVAEVGARFAAFDTNGDGLLSEREFQRAEASRRTEDGLPVPEMPEGVDAWFGLRALADADGSGDLTLAELTAWFQTRVPEGETAWPARRMPNPARLPAAMQGGVAPGLPAPDFTLSPPDGGKPVTLSSFRGQRPVALIFGSYT